MWSTNTPSTEIGTWDVDKRTVGIDIHATRATQALSQNSWEQFTVAINSQDYYRACQICEQEIRSVKNERDEGMWRQNYTTVLVLMDRIEDALQLCDATIDRFEKTRDFELCKVVILAYMHKGEMLTQKWTWQEWVASYDQALALFYDASLLKERIDYTQWGLIGSIQAMVGRVAVRKAMTLHEYKKSRESIEVYDDVIERFADQFIHSRDRHELVSVALFNKICILIELNRRADAIAEYQHLQRRESVLRTGIDLAFIESLLSHPSQ